MSKVEQITIEKKNIENEIIFIFHINDDANDNDWIHHFTNFLPTLEKQELYFIIDNPGSRDAITLDGQLEAIKSFININLSKVRIAAVSPDKSYESIARLFNKASENEKLDGSSMRFSQLVDAENWLLKQMNR